MYIYTRLVAVWGIKKDEEKEKYWKRKKTSKSKMYTDERHSRPIVNESGRSGNEWTSGGLKEQVPKMKVELMLNWRILTNELTSWWSTPRFVSRDLRPANSFFFFFIYSLRTLVIYTHMYMHMYLCLYVCACIRIRIG